MWELMMRAERGTLFCDLGSVASLEDAARVILKTKTILVGCLLPRICRFVRLAGRRLAAIIGEVRELLCDILSCSE